MENKIFVEFEGSPDGDAAGFNARHVPETMHNEDWYDSDLRVWVYVQPEDYFTLEEKATIGRWIDEHRRPDEDLGDWIKSGAGFMSAEDFFEDLDDAPTDDDWAEYYRYAREYRDSDYWDCGKDIADRHIGEEWRDLRAALIEEAAEHGIPAEVLDFSAYDGLLDDGGR